MFAKILFFIAILQTPFLPPVRPIDTEHAAFTYCNQSARINCIVDGDTFWYEGRKIRIADINTPEISRPQCDYELQNARLAKTRLYEILNSGNFSLISAERDKDFFGRYLRIVKKNGVSIGDTLIAEGLAHRWQGHKKSWC